MSDNINIPSLFNDPNRSTRPELQKPDPLPMTPEEVAERGWTEVDVVFVTGDAYVDSPSFANGLLARVLEKDGFKVAVLSQPNWNSADDFRKFGRPRLAFCISAGNMDSMINHYTASRKIRNSDAYTPGGKIGSRPDRATLAYCQRAREAYPGTPIITGGIEASLRRIAHYDYWSDKVRRSIALDAKADLLIYGMGERPLLTIMRRLNTGESIRDIRNVRGTVYKLGKNEELPEESSSLEYLPSYDEVAENEKTAKLRFVRMTQIAYENLNPYRAKTLVQEHGEEAIVVNPPDFPLSEEEMNAVYSLPFTRQAHPSYKEPIPAVEVVRSTVQTHRGCFGGCTFCAITAHQGKFIQSRSEDEIVAEVQKLADEAGGNYVVSDLNAPTANMYRMQGKNQEACKRCARISCLCPEICLNLNVDHTAYIELLKRVRNVEGVKSVLIASGIRTDLAIFSPEFIKVLAAYHTGGHLKTAPEHVDDDVLKLMNKPSIENYENFCEQFIRTSRELGKEQYLVPYLIAGFPGCTLQSMVEVAEYLKKNDIRPEQVQDFIPAPFQIATCAYYTGVDPITEDSVYVPRGMRERRLQHALLLYYNLSLYHDVKSALKEAGREDLIGDGENALIPSHPPKSLSLRQGSRIKRLIRQDERDAQAKELRRSQFSYLEDGNDSSSKKRVGRDERRKSGGYRASAREYGAGSRYRSDKEWDPIDKVWRKREDRDAMSETQSPADRKRFGKSNLKNDVRDHSRSKLRENRPFSSNGSRDSGNGTTAPDGDGGERPQKDFRRRDRSSDFEFQKKQKFGDAGDSRRFGHARPSGASFPKKRAYKTDRQDSNFRRDGERFGGQTSSNPSSQGNGRFSRDAKSGFDRSDKKRGDSNSKGFSKKGSFKSRRSGFRKGGNSQHGNG